jgi:bacteriorhodopsin
VTLLFVIAIVLIVTLVGSLPTWPHSRNWGYYPVGGVGVIILIIVLIVLFTGHLRAH